MLNCLYCYVCVLASMYYCTCMYSCFCVYVVKHLNCRYKNKNFPYSSAVSTFSDFFSELSSLSSWALLGGSSCACHTFQLTQCSLSSSVLLGTAMSTCFLITPADITLLLYPFREFRVFWNSGGTEVLISEAVSSHCIVASDPSVALYMYK